jgi:hypothetical protein
MRALVLLTVLSLCAACATPQTEPVAVVEETPPDPAEQRALLIQKIEDFHRSIREGDKEGYAGVFTDDFVFTWSRNGQIYDKESILPNVVPTPDFHPLVDELLVRIHGDAAVLNFRVRKSEGEGEPGARVTFSCGRVGDEWKVLASHSTPIVVDEDAATDE